jgi:hypothetical protein
MPEFEITNTTKLIATAIAIITAYMSSSDWLKDFLKRLNPIGPAMSSDNTPDIDVAVRVLFNDSKSRKCRRSVQLLNEWAALRNMTDMTPPPVPPSMANPVTSSIRQITPVEVPQ